MMRGVCSKKKHKHATLKKKCNTPDELIGAFDGTFDGVLGGAFDGASGGKCAAKQVQFGAARVPQADATVDAPRQSFQHSSDRGIDKLVIVTLGVK